MRRVRLNLNLLAYLAIVFSGLAFFYKPLFRPDFSFPWDFRSVQLPLVNFLAGELTKGHFALWDPYTYCGDPIFANIQASYFHPLVFLSALVSAHYVGGRFA